jgi:hypothetical protein
MRIKMTAFKFAIAIAAGMSLFALGTARAEQTRVTFPVNLDELVPFITHGGYGLGNSLAVVRDHAPSARIAREFSKQCDQERETLEQVTDWLSRV